MRYCLEIYYDRLDFAKWAKENIEKEFNVEVILRKVYGFKNGFSYSVVMKDER